MAMILTFSRNALCFLLLHSLAASAPAVGVYRWVDAHGKVHYGDRPPSAERPTETVEITGNARGVPPTSPDTDARRLKQRRLLEAFKTERERKQARMSKARADKALREKNCQRARRNLALYQRSGVLANRGKDGKRTYLTDAERERVLARSEAAIARWCRR